MCAHSNALPTRWTGRHMCTHSNAVSTRWTDRHMWCAHTKEYYSPLKGKEILLQYAWNLRKLCEVKQLSHKKTSSAWLNEARSSAPSMGRKQRVAARPGRGKQSCFSVSTDLQFRMWKRHRDWLNSHMNVLVWLVESYVCLFVLFQNRFPCHVCWPLCDPRTCLLSIAADLFCVLAYSMQGCLHFPCN